MRVFLRFLLVAFTFSCHGIFLASCCTKANAQLSTESAHTPVVVSHERSIKLGTSIFIYLDHDYSLTVEEARSEAFAKNFVRNDTEVGNAGNTKAIIWCKFQIRNDIDEELFLVLSNPLANDIVLYEVNEDTGTVDSTLYSSHYPFGKRVISIPNFAFPLGIAKDEVRSYFIKFETTYPLDFPLTVSSESEILKQHGADSLLIGLFIGVVVIMVLYNLFIFLGIRDKIYLSYIFYVISMGLFVIHIKGFAFALIWPNSPWINQFPAILPSLAATAAVFFSSQFLQIKKHHTNIFRMMQVCYVLLGLSSVLNVTYVMGVFESRLPITISGINIQVTVVFACITLVLAGIKAYKRGFLPASAYLIAWVSLLFSVTTYILYNVGLIPGNAWVSHSMEFGVALETCLLSFALTIKIRQERDDREKAEQLTLQKEIEKSKLIEEERARLEVKVADRTKELSKLNSTKDHFFSIISHDLRSVISSFHGIGHMINQNIKRQRFQKAEALSDQLDKEANNLHGLLDNLLNWSINQLGETPFKLQSIDLNAVIKRVYELYMETARSKGISFKMKLDGNHEVEADFDALNIILRNLISNAIKFTAINGLIEISALRFDERVRVTITDTGIGVGNETIEAINKSIVMTSSNGTSGEKGNGLGLKLCKEYLELHSSELEIKNHSEGASFSFSLHSLS